MVTGRARFFAARSAARRDEVRWHDGRGQARLVLVSGAADAEAWFRTLPTSLELPDGRVVERSDGSAGVAFDALAALCAGWEVSASIASEQVAIRLRECAEQLRRVVAVARGTAPAATPTPAETTGLLVLVSDRNATPIRRVVGDVLAAYLEDLPGRPAPMPLDVDLDDITAALEAADGEREWLVRVAARLVEHIARIDAARAAEP